MLLRVAALRFERFPELRHVHADDVLRGPRRVAVPEIVDDPVGRHHLVAVQQQKRQERALPRSAENDATAAVHHLEGPEQAELHKPF
ncbi:MAG TPA: hypothetical protein VFI37_09045 [Gaiellaceae bacterium]|nr:hypothetical protein [Gaiellaceae bacterium]